MVDYMQEESSLAGDLLDNSADRVVICICVDSSYSMIVKKKMDHVNKGINNFIRECQNDIYARDAIDMCIIACGGDKPSIIQEFANVKDVRFDPIKPNGGTPLGAAVEMALNKIDDRIEDFVAYGNSYYKPWLIIMSDGKSGDDIHRAANKVRNLTHLRKLKLALVDMSEKEENSNLSDFIDKDTNDVKIETIDTLHIEDFFSMLSKSAAGLSTTTPGADE